MYLRILFDRISSLDWWSFIIKVKRANYTSKTKSNSKCQLWKLNVLMSKYYFLTWLDFNVEIGFFFGNGDIKALNEVIRNRPQRFCRQNNNVF